MPKITKIPASISRYTSAPIDAPVKRKVAAYARVSTDSEEQLTSYAAQISYYTDQRLFHQTQRGLSANDIGRNGRKN